MIAMGWPEVGGARGAGVVMIGKEREC